MNVIKLRTLREFWCEHPEAEESLSEWFRRCRKGRWQNIQEMRRVFPHADAVTVDSGRTATVFNVGGNKYRVIAFVDYPRQRMLVTHVLTHAGYNTDRWKRQL